MKSITIQVPAVAFRFLSEASMSATVEGWNTGHNAGRFVHLNFFPAKIPKRGHLYWFREVLNVYAAQALLNEANLSSIIYLDEMSDNGTPYVLWVAAKSEDIEEAMKA